MNIQNQYPEDEFDREARNREIYGAHRQARKFSPWLVALIAVLLLSPAVGVGLGYLLGNNPSTASVITEKITESTNSESTNSSESTTNSESSTTTTEETADETAKAEAEAAAAAEAKAQEEAAAKAEEEAKAAILSAQIQILNGTRINGLAGRKAGVLTSAGFTNVATGNYSFSAPAQSTVYYRDADSAAVAAEVASKLGISAQVEDINAVPSPLSVVVVLRSE
ncbi:MAG: LytR C-terminal domain-containing protein [Arcanobacterium sp.]|nr:LytR C-terminal domain-containing protein [Arcanobacterium sp.]